MSTPMDWFRAQYGVPAKRGGRVEYTPCEGSKDEHGKLGTITGTQGPHLLIRLDGEKHSHPYHPTWQLRYLDASPSPSQERLAMAGSKHTAGRIRTVEYEAGWGWIARCPKTGTEIMEDGFRWRTRSGARCVVADHKIFGCDHRCAAAIVKAEGSSHA